MGVAKGRIHQIGGRLRGVRVVELSAYLHDLLARFAGVRGFSGGRNLAQANIKNGHAKTARPSSLKTMICKRKQTY